MRLVICGLILLSLLASSAPGCAGNPAAKPDMAARVQTPTASNAAYLLGVPYVWQEIGGFCGFASYSMAAQYLGLDMDMEELFAVCGAGFSALYVNSEQDLMFYPGVFFRQMPRLYQASELYGIEMSVLVDISTEQGRYAANVWSGYGVNYTALTGDDDAFTFLEDTISQGLPLVIAVDCSKLPVRDYDVLREQGLDFARTAVSHAVTVVGYNDTSKTVRVYDPGVGAIGEEYGYPHDGRWNYTMSYASLESAWAPTGFSGFYLRPGLGKAQDFGVRLLEETSRYLSGNRTAYLGGFENFYFMSVGASAFRGMSLDFDSRGLRAHLEYFDEMYWPQVLRGMGQAFEQGITLQYVSYRAALDSVPILLADANLTEFLVEAQKALPHLEALSCNASLTSVHPAERSTPVYAVMTAIAADYEEHADLTYALELHLDELVAISNHLASIADSWESSGDAIARNSGTLPDEHTTAGFVAVGLGASVIILIAVPVVRRAGEPLSE